MKKLIYKFIVPDKVVFEDFDKNLEANRARVKMDFDKVVKDITAFSKDRNIQELGFVEAFNSEANKIYEYLNNSIGSESFAINVACCVNAVKWYTLNFLMTDKGKSQGAIRNTDESLGKLKDILIFKTIEYLRMVKKFDCQYNNGFYCECDNESYSVLRMIDGVLSTINSLRDSISYKKGKPVSMLLVDLRDIELYSVSPSSEDIFGF